MSLYGTAQRLVRLLWPLIGRLDVTGKEHIPDDGPFLLIANHQSYLDPILIQAVVHRPIYTMAKSTEFSNPLIGGLLKRLKSFPVRRFEIDPQAVRIVLRHLEAGRGVGIYIEGERTWDGRLKTPRLGTLRLILRAGVPVVPCGISGAYDVWPRWDRQIKRGTVRIRFGEPLSCPEIHDRNAREAALPEARDRVMTALSDLSGAGRTDE
ncbi:MAG: lysophospholipid acyltransferase family protein [Candidatus Longimicrobiales bacterium M2_2A_002]